MSKTTTYDEFLTVEGNNDGITNTKEGSAVTPSGSGATTPTVPTFTPGWNKDATEYVDESGMKWSHSNQLRPDLLYNEYNINWEDWHNGHGMPKDVPTKPLVDVKPTVTQPMGFGSYLSGANGSGYGEYLANAGKGVQAGYDQAVAAARRGYEQGKATYGASGESLARAGLTGSGYSDYLEGKAFSAMQQNIGAAERGRAQSYADYLTSAEQSAASLAEYLAGQEAAAKEKLDLAINGAITSAINGGSKYVSIEALKEYAAQQGVAFDDATMASITDRLAAQGITVADRATVENYNNTEAANAEVEAAAELRAANIAEIKEFAKTGVTIDQIKNKAKNSYGIELSDEELADISAYVQGETGSTPLTTEEAIEANINLWVSENVGNFANVDQMVTAMEAAKKPAEQIEAAKQMYFTLQKNAVSDVIDEFDGSASDLSSLYSVEKIDAMIDKTITKEQAAELKKKVSAKIYQIAEKAYSTYMSGKDDEAVRSKLGINSEQWEEMMDEERPDAIFKAVCEIYDSGSMNDADMTKFVDRFVNDTVSNNEYGTRDLGQLAIILEDNLPKLWHKYSEKLINDVLGKIKLDVNESTYSARGYSATVPSSILISLPNGGNTVGAKPKTYYESNDGIESGTVRLAGNGQLEVKTGNTWVVFDEKSFETDSGKAVFNLLLGKYTMEEHRAKEAQNKKTNKGFGITDVSDAVSRNKNSSGFAAYLTNPSTSPSGFAEYLTGKSK